MPMFSEQDRVESLDSPDRLEQLGFGRSFNDWVSLSKSLDNQEITKDDEIVAESLLLLLRDTSTKDNDDEKRTETITTMKMVCGAHYIPKDSPEFPLGEDAYFVSKEAQTIGVADGVGGWAQKGIDAGEYARELMTHALISANYRARCLNRKKRKARKKEKADDEMIGAVDPARVMKAAYTKTKENLRLQGSSTACILSFEGEKGLLHTANLGDSGFMVFRDSKLMFQSLPQQHSFNCPYQMSNGGKINDRPKKANKVVVGMLPGDTIVMGTDGLLDNIYPEQIEQILQATADSQDLASLIAEIALQHSKDEKFDSPFSRAAQKAGFDYPGGKIDDITVIVAQIVA